MKKKEVTTIYIALGVTIADKKIGDFDERRYIKT